MNVMKILFFGALLVGVITPGCTRDYLEVESSHLDQAFVLNSSPTFRGYDYLGSQADYHYFVAKWKFGRDQRFKVLESDLSVMCPMPLGRQGIQVFLHKPDTHDAVEFGTIGQTTLYRKK